MEKILVFPGGYIHVWSRKVNGKVAKVNVKKMVHKSVARRRKNANHLYFRLTSCFTSRTHLTQLFSSYARGRKVLLYVCVNVIGSLLLIISSCCTFRDKIFARMNVRDTQSVSRVIAANLENICRFYFFSK